MRSRTLCLVVALAAVVGTGGLRAADDDTGFVSLFDGRTLEGWRGDPALWKVEDGAIVGTTDGNIPDNTFLIREGEFDDFVLKIKFRLHNHQGNSGVQYRSQELKELDGRELPPFVVGGYQADIASDRHMGILYGEKLKGRGIIQDVTPEITAALEQAVIKDGWNEYVITAKGPHVTQVLNGVTTVDVDDPDGPRSGIIALQLHRGHDMRVSFKEILIRTLD